MFEKKPATINSSGISWWRGGGRFIHFSILCIINIEILPSKQYIFETREGGYFSKVMGNINSKILTGLYSHVGQAQNTSEDARMLMLDRTFWVSSETGEIFNVFGPLGLATRFWGANVSYWYLKLDAGVLSNLLKTELGVEINSRLSDKSCGRHKYFHRRSRDWNIAGGGLIRAKFGPNSSIIPLPQLRGSFWGAAERGREQGFGKAHWKAKIVQFLHNFAWV